jgi:HlyD family secretion protein
MRASLMQTQTGSKLQLMESQTVRMRTERDYQTAGNQQIETKHAISSKKAERQAYIDDWNRQMLEDLVRVRTEINRVDENLAKAVRIHDLVVISAPEDGVVLEVARRSVGSVLQGGEPLVTLLPSGEAMIADVSIGSADIGHIKQGDEAVIKVDAFPYQKHGSLNGRLRTISQDSGSGAVQSSQQAIASALGRGSAGGEGGAYHRAQVTVDEIKLKNMPKGVALIPGMTVSAEIKVGTRSVISYFLYPLTRGLTESMREP